MNRRSFFSTLAKAAIGFTILPAATTYSRIWRVQRQVLPVVFGPYYKDQINFLSDREVAEVYAKYFKEYYRQRYLELTGRLPLGFSIRA
jgi:hypothetical protein